MAAEAENEAAANTAVVRILRVFMSYSGLQD